MEASARIRVSGFRLDTLVYILRLLRVQVEIVTVAAQVINPSSEIDPKQWLINLPNDWTVADLEGAILHCGNHFTFIEFVEGIGWAHYDWFEGGLTPLTTQMAFHTKFFGCTSIAFVRRITHTADAMMTAQARLLTDASEFIKTAMSAVATYKISALPDTRSAVPPSRSTTTPTGNTGTSQSASAAKSTTGRNNTYSSNLRVCQNHMESIKRQLAALSRDHGVHYAGAFFRVELGVNTFSSHPNLELRTSLN
jgi:hypothetical protein